MCETVGDFFQVCLIFSHFSGVDGERHLGLPRPPLAADDRSAGAGQPLDPQPRKSQQSENHQTDRSQLPAHDGELHPYRDAHPAGGRGRDAGPGLRARTAETNIHVGKFPKK